MTALINLPRAAWKRQPSGVVEINYASSMLSKIKQFFIPLGNGHVISHVRPNVNTTSKTPTHIGTAIKFNGSSGYIESDFGSIQSEEWSQVFTGRLNIYDTSEISTLAVSLLSHTRGPSLHYHWSEGAVAYVYDGSAKQVSTNNGSSNDVGRYLLLSARCSATSLVANKNRESNSIAVSNTGELYSAKCILGCGGMGNLNSSHHLLHSYFYFSRYLANDELYQFLEPGFVYTLLKSAPSRFYLIPGSGAVTFNLSSILTSASLTSDSAVQVLRPITTTLTSSSNTATSAANVLRDLSTTLSSASETSASAANLLRTLASSLASSSETSVSSVAILRNLATSLTSQSSTSTITLTVTGFVDLMSAIASLSSSAAMSVNVLRPVSSTLTSTSSTASISVTVAALIELVSALLSLSSTNAVSVAVARPLSSALSSLSSTASITVNTTTLVALASAVASQSLTATSALNIARALSSALASPSHTANAAANILRPLVSAPASLSSTASIVLEAINQVALASTVSSQSSTSTAHLNVVRALISTLLSASNTSAISTAVLREIASALVSASATGDVDLSLAMVGQVELTSLIESQSLTSDQTRLLADLVAAITDEMKVAMTGTSPALRMTGFAPSLKMTGSGLSIAVH